MSGFKKATKKTAKLRAALFGPSGSGKTFTALRIATGLGGPIAVIDTERGSASKYADRFDFDVLELSGTTIEDYIAAIGEAARAGYAVLAVDSLSHGWKELLDEVDRLAKAKYRGNSWSAWSEGTPKQRKLVDAILGYPGHLIATMRSKTEWSEETDDRGKKKPVRVGLAPEQGKGIEYEFDLLVELSTDHIGNVLKDRTGKFQDLLLEKPGEDFGRALAAWLDAGEAPSEPPRPAARTAAPRGEPAPADTTAPAVDPKLETFVAKLVARAEATGEWGKAEEVAAAKLSGDALAYARERLDVACDLSRGAGAQERAPKAPGEPATPADDPSACDPAAELDKETRAKVSRLVSQAARLGNWAAAKDGARARFQGAALDAALAGIDAAQARAAAAAEATAKAA